MVRLKAVHMILIISVIAIFLVSILLVIIDRYTAPVAVLFSFLNIIGATFPPDQGLLDARDSLILTAVALGTIGNLAFTILFTTIFYQLLGGVDVRYFVSKQRIRRQSKHVIITPMNGMALELAKKIREQNIGVVLIDEDRQHVRNALAKGYMTVRGDPAREETLRQAKISSASELFALYEDDVKNTFVALASRAANRRVRIVSRIKSIENIPKIERAGAKRIILPEAVVGTEIGNFLVSRAAQ